ncbi:hypothetical protein [Herpetosiphon geysericola]|uniref:Holliday junction resolvase RuvC n=1 Tax=Herpetosiphon geysericola TaxID=70996 RepID=A0A0P6Y3W3_9CHLR|nr:hypothetical protein [Herpetosiphon geysericola]KPL90665.1 hypothetical protein SE18_06280 [Herpetosiphon geysericola]
MILALDISAANLGMVIFERATARVVEHAHLDLDARRCTPKQRIILAVQSCQQWLRDYPKLVECVINAPVPKTHPADLIACQRIVGALIGLIYGTGLPVTEISLATAKRQLIGHQYTDRASLMQAAAMYFDTDYSEYEASALALIVGYNQELFKRNKQQVADMRHFALLKA